MQITRFRGDTFPDCFTVSNSETGEAANITGSVFTLTVDSKENPTDSSSKLYQLIGDTSKSPEAGLVEFSPTAEQANQVGFFYFDVQMVSTYGKTFTLVKGAYVYKQDITK